LILLPSSLTSANFAYGVHLSSLFFSYCILSIAPHFLSFVFRVCFISHPRIDPQEATTADNVKIHLGGNLYVRFVDSYRAAYGAEMPVYAVSQLAQSIMRTAVGTYNLDKLFSERTGRV
jgi:regulator of protease activity HflC (stomatin/prohibitin superfamily)